MTKNTYILDSSYAEYIKNTLSDKYPEQLVLLQFDNKLEELVINIGTLAIKEHDQHYHLMDNSSPKKANTNHVMAKEHAHALIKQLLENLYSNNNSINSN